MMQHSRLVAYDTRLAALSVTIRRYSESVQVSSVVIVILLQTAVGQVPVLDHTIPVREYNNWVVFDGGEVYAGYPVSVIFLLEIDLASVLALGKSIPQLDGLVSAARHNLMA